MGFYEYDRIRHKNRAYNFPTPEVNSAARRILDELSDLSGPALVEELRRRIGLNDDKHTIDALKTAIVIVTNN